VLAAGLAVVATSEAACLAIAAHPEGTLLARITAPAAFTVSYLHSVTRTPVTERYHVEGTALVQDAIAFSEHGPGLPTAADAEGAFVYADGVMVMTMRRPMPSIVMRVHAAQSPRLIVHAHEHDLAAWGNRAIVLSGIDGGCPLAR
jgi:hypothetical protein